MNEKAEPALMDTGTFFVETRACRHCHLAIEQELLAGKVAHWVHSDGRGAYCRGLRTRPARREERRR